MSYINTFTGLRINVLDPKPGEIDVRDVAHGMSNLCRFSGQCKRFYSVARHSIAVAGLVTRDHRLSALLHDASEAYLVDVPRPLKELLSEYKQIESVWLWAIAERFGIPDPIPASVKTADEVAGAIEAEALFGPPGSDAALPFSSPEKDERLFLRTFERYTGRSQSDWYADV